MDVNHLKYFVTVVEQKNFTKAANLLHISQPSLSIAIKKMEQNAGLSLLDRSKRTIDLTREGEILYIEAKKLINHLQYINDEMARLKKEGPLELSIGMIETVKVWLPKVLKEIKEEYSDLQIKLFEILGLDDVKNAIRNYDIHFAITNQNIVTKEIESIPLYNESLVALVPDGNSLENKEYLTIQDFKNQPFILCKEGFQTRVDILNAFSRGGIKPNVQFEFEGFETACSLVEVGLGITIVPENYVNHQSDSSYHVKRINDSGMTRKVYLALDKTRYLPPLVNKSIEIIKEYQNNHYV